jgi:hypothetical protein
MELGPEELQVGYMTPNVPIDYNRRLESNVELEHPVDIADMASLMPAQHSGGCGASNAKSHRLQIERKSIQLQRGRFLHFKDLADVHTDCVYRILIFIGNAKSSFEESAHLASNAAT